MCCYVSVAVIVKMVIDKDVCSFCVCQRDRERMWDVQSVMGN